MKIWQIFVVLFVTLVLISVIIIKLPNQQTFTSTPVPSTVSDFPPLTPEETPSNSVTINGLTFLTPTDFALATETNQILSKAVIPPCDSNFDYCVYYNGSDWKGTNFESAGVRISNRTDIATPQNCLTTNPSGYSNLTPTVKKNTYYSLSTFGSITGGAAGHTTSGTLYRVSFNSLCYEFETRIGTSQYQNYPTGSIKQFTNKDQSIVEEKIRNFLTNIRFTEHPEITIFATDSAILKNSSSN